MLADVGHLDHVGIHAFALGRLAEGLQVHVGRAGGDDDAVERSRALHRAIDRIREKYGEQAVKRGPVALAEKLREREE